MADELQQTPEATPAPAGGEAPALNNDASVVAELQRKYVEATNKHQQESWQTKQQIQKMQAELEEAKAAANKYSDPYEAFTGMGGDFDELANRLVANGQPSMPAQLKAVSDELAAIKKAQHDRDEQTRQEKARQDNATYFNNYAGDLFREITGSEDHQIVNDLLEMQRELTGVEPQDLLAKTVAGPLRERYQRDGKVLTPSEFLATMKAKAAVELEKLKNSKVLRRIMGLDEVSPEPTPDTANLFNDPPRTISQQQSTSIQDQGEDLGTVPNSKFYQLIDAMSKKS